MKRKLFLDGVYIGTTVNASVAADKVQIEVVRTGQSVTKERILACLRVERGCWSVQTVDLLTRDFTWASYGLPQNNVRIYPEGENTEEASVYLGPEASAAFHAACNDFAQRYTNQFKDMKQILLRTHYAAHKPAHRLRQAS